MATAFDDALRAFSPGLPLAVALSGGADSTALLLGCAERFGAQALLHRGKARFGKARDALAVRPLALGGAAHEIARPAEQERALARGLTLRDASAYNVQFVAGRPLFIDTLSFEPREPGAPWAGYRQFCEHFLVPLALMSWVDVRLSALLRSHLEGIPLDLGSRLLPRSTWLRLGLLFHVHLHVLGGRRLTWPPG